MPKKPRFKHPLRLVRTATGMSQAEFAETLRCSRHTLQAVENGRMRVSYAMEGRIFVETGANTREIAKGRRGKALDQKGQPYSKEFYESWRERKNNYDSSSALKDFEELLGHAAQCGKLSELLVAAQECFFDLRESLRESDVTSVRA